MRLLASRASRRSWSLRMYGRAFSTTFKVGNSRQRQAHFLPNLRFGRNQTWHLNLRAALTIYCRFACGGPAHLQGFRTKRKTHYVKPYFNGFKLAVVNCYFHKRQGPQTLHLQQFRASSFPYQHRYSMTTNSGLPQTFTSFSLIRASCS